MLNFNKPDIISNIMATLSVTSVVANFDAVLTTFILLSTLIINGKIIWDKFKLSDKFKKKE